MGDPDFHVFLCHNSQDKPVVEEIAERLRACGLRPWLDKWELRPGLSWQRALEAQIEKIGAAAVFVGASGLGPWQNLEVEAYLRQFVNHGCPVIPVLLPGCSATPKLPVFLEGMTWVDWRDAAPDPLELLVWGITGVKPVGLTTGLAAPDVRVSIARLPVTGGAFVGRDAELARLDAAWIDPETRILSLVAFGGVGKSALVSSWLDAMAADGWRGAERVLGWSFYSQGADATGVSADAFVDFALRWFGFDGDPPKSPWERGEVLAQRIRKERALLILDGLEALQHPPGAQTGRIRDPATQALVRELMAKSRGLCVITTRLPIADIAGRGGVEQVDLEKLPPVVGAELLRSLGVKGPDDELRAASEDFAGHGLALTLLGTYLRDVAGGDVRRRGEVELLDEEIEQGGHARCVMASYEAWLGEGPELQLLRLIGLFDRPAEAEAVAALRAAPAVTGLTDGLESTEETHFRHTLARLRKAGLLTPASDSADILDTHPLVRAFFDERLRTEHPEAWRAGHERLYEHYKTAVPERPTTLEAIMPLYAAVGHGCQAGRPQAVVDEVFLPRIRRGNEAFSVRKLAAFGAELTALAAFFERPWDCLVAGLREADQAWLLNAAGFVLRALGRLPEAVQPMRAGLALRIAQKKWKNAAVIAGNLSELRLTLGEVQAAVEAGEESVALANRSGDAGQQMSKRTTLADALHQAGHWEVSAATFREAEAMQAEMQPAYPRLYSLQGYQYCDLLLSMAAPDDGAGPGAPGSAPEVLRQACKEVLMRASWAIEITEQNPWLLDIALDNLSLGRAWLGLAQTPCSVSTAEAFTRASKHLDRAVGGLRKSGEQEFLARGVLTRAALRRHQNNPTAAARDLGEAQDIAERGHMRLHEADVHLEWTRLHLAQGDKDAARRHLTRARELVEECGYGRRRREVAWLERRLES